MRGMLVGLIFCCGFFLPATAGGAPVRLLTIAASINPVTADFIRSQIELANRQQDAALLLQLDTPGGLDTAMREIIQAQLGSTIPIIVFVGPAGARAASAGALITLAADFAAMAPGTSIGAAHPVSLGPGGSGGKDNPMLEKVLNDAAAYARSIAQQRGRNQEWAENAVRKSVSIPAEEAVDRAVVDLLADNPRQLLGKLDGYKYIRNGKPLIFASQGLELVPAEMTARQQILNAISNPNVAYLLMMLGIVGIFFEISQPGVILPGVIGAIAFLLALFAFSALPVNYVGVLLILLAFVLFVLEIKVASYGMLTVSGIVAMAFGSLMLIDSSAPYLQISGAVIAATVTACSAFFLFALSMVVKTQKRPAVSGQEGMVGETGRVVKTIDGRGSVFVHGEYWQARADQPIAEGRPVEVLRMHGLELEVRELPDTPAAETEE